MSSPPSEASVAARPLVVAGAVALALAVLWHGLRPIADVDVWWQLRMGQEALETRSTLPFDTWSFTMAGRPWPYKDLGVGVVYALVWSLAGPGGLVALKGLLIAATLAMVARLLAARNVPAPLVLVLLAVAVPAVAFRFTDRPQVFSFFLLVVALAVIERHRRGLGSLHLLGVIALVNANLHRGALVLPVVVAAYAIACAVNARRADDPDRARRATRDAIAGTLVTVAGCLLTPFGFAGLTTSRAMLADPRLRDAIPEWWAATPGHVWDASPVTAVFALALAALALVQLRSLRTFDPWDLALGGLAFALGAQGVRFLPYLVLFGLFPLARLLDGPADLRAVWRSPRRGVPALLAPLAALAAVLTSPLPTPRLALMPGRYPDAALERVRELQPKGPMLNEFGLGGWLVFHAPEFPVFIDGRNDILYPPEFVRGYVDAMEDAGALERITRAHDLQWAFLDAHPDARSRLHFERSGWVPVYIGQNAFVFVRGDGPNAEMARSFGYRLLAPHDLSGSILAAARDPSRHEALLREADRLVGDDPEGIHAHTARAKVLLALGPRHAADLEEELAWLRARGVPVP
jgi:hypothetical protein